VANQRAEIALTPAELDALLREVRTLVLVTLGPDGLPDPVPMWFVLDGEGVPWMRTYAASQKVRNLERDPRAVALLEAGEHYTELRGAQLTGRITVVEDVDRISAVMADLMVRYEGLDPAHLDDLRAAYRDRAAKQRALRFDVERTVSWDHRKLVPTRPPAE
jgi:PPOX class probable F420-dependent enzyme